MIPTAPFSDAQDMQRQYPETFEAPTMDELYALRPGMSVKVCAAGERFWVTITGIVGDLIGGKVDNDLIGTPAHGMRYGDAITFERRHVYQIYQEETALAGRQH